MNVLVFFPEELQNNLITVVGRRGAHLAQTIKVVPGQSLRVAQVNVGLGSGIVRTVDPGKVVVEVPVLSPVPKPAAIEIILAMPRPQTLKKVLELCGTMAIAHLTIIGSARVERSYFNSPILQPERYREYLHIGMEQGANPFMTTVEIAPRFRDFSTTGLPAMLNDCDSALLAHPASADTLAEIAKRKPFTASKRTLLAVGPEGGWRDSELEVFEKHRFSFFRLSSNILRVEHAVCAALAQLELLRER